MAKISSALLFFFLIPVLGYCANGDPVLATGSSADSNVVAFDGATGKCIKDSGRAVEDNMTDGSNLPDGHAIKAYGDTNWSAGSGDVVGPASATDNNIPLFDGTTGKLIKDSTRLIEDSMTDGSNLPDGAAIKVYGDTNWSSGGYTNLTSFVDQTAWRLFYSNTDGNVTELVLGTSGQYLKANGVAAAPTWDTPASAGDVMGPATHAADYVPQWNSTPNSKTLVEGFEVTDAGKAILDDADAATQRTTLGLGTAALRAAEDTLTNGSNLPDGAAIKTYGDANWSGGSGGDFSDGGEAGGANRTLGNTDAYSLGFETNNVARITIGSTGHATMASGLDMILQGTGQFKMAGGVYALTTGGTDFRVFTPGSTAIRATNQNFRPTLWSMFATKTDECQKVLMEMNLIQRSGDGSPNRGITGLVINHYSMADNGGEVSGLLACESGGGNAITCYKAHTLRPTGYTDYASSGGMAFECGTADQGQAAFFASGMQSWGAHSNAANCIVCQLANSNSKGICITPENNGVNFDTRQAFAIGSRTLNQSTDNNRTLWMNLNGDLYAKRLFINTNTSPICFKNNAGVDKNMLYLNNADTFCIGGELASGHLAINIDGSLKMLSIDANGFVKAS